MLEPPLLEAQRRDLALAHAQLVLRLHVRVERLPVEEADEHEPADGEHPVGPEHVPTFVENGHAPAGPVRCQAP